MEGRIVHIALPDDWRAAQASGEYTVSTRGVSLAEEGFIHCSFEHQLERTANAYYGDLDQLVLLTIDPSRVESPIVVEPPAPGVADEFPHVYGPIPLRRWSSPRHGHAPASTWKRD